jgi:hypothetical protein
VTTYPLDFTDYAFKPVIQTNDKKIKLGSFAFSVDENLDFGKLGTVGVGEIMKALEHRLWLTKGTLQTPLAALIFSITRVAKAMNGCFPIVLRLSKAERFDFHQSVVGIINHPYFDIRLFGEKRTDHTAEMPPDAAYIIAGHLVEIFFFRRDILEQFLSTPRHFYLYTNRETFAHDGGVAGGNFNPSRDAIQLVISRLYEGFFTPTPGAAPFIHELGHMLDHFEAKKRGKTRTEGLLPGLHPDNEAIFTPDAREHFRRGKQLELDRYLNWKKKPPLETDLATMPIGHPYVFQNDGEFIAGYLEMFFRNPNYFAAQNEKLYNGFALLFKQDPCIYWDLDYPYYVGENRKFYLSGQRSSAPNLTI